MRVKTITWKHDPYNVFDRMKDEPWGCVCRLQRQGAIVHYRTLKTWEVRWP